MTEPYSPHQQRYPDAGEQARGRLAAALAAPTVPLWQLNQPTSSPEDSPLLRPVWRRYFDQQRRRER
jgi:hypothetical protein